ncbi:MAG: D-alanyl-D-alanine carboxypeptidase [Oscillospiraceae bacterium]|jgi:D-alanyl-D-alanine carboxypeptidase (penicillin-binding protein 5/6)|nr:D-alanyl-D-alanine carboxypeptidase [Oscillospiraceae bacterium]
MRRTVVLLLLLSTLCKAQATAAVDSAPDQNAEPAIAYLDPETDDVFDEEPWAETVFAPADVPARAAILMEKETGTIVYAGNEHERLPPASVTKDMTMLLVAEAIDSGRLKLSDVVTASATASKMGGSQIYLRENERMSVADLLKAVAVGSANDASVALAEHLAGSEAAFVTRMNARAKELGMNDTAFANCTGLPSGSEHVTSAFDVAVMSRELIRHSFIRDYTTIWMDTVRNGEFGLSNTNKLVRFYPGTTGLKTGYTAEAQYCLSATAERDGVEFIAVILGAPSSNERFDAAKSLLSFAFANYALTDVSPEEPLAPIPVKLGTSAYVQPTVRGERKLLVERSAKPGLTRTVELPEFVSAPISSGAELGRLIIRDASGNVLMNSPLCAAEEVPKVQWGGVLLRYLKLLLFGQL